jgi:hypothetical protein
MKITEMNREQLREFMKGNGDIHRYNVDAITWKYAFKLAKLSGYENLEMDCSKCIDKVKEWLNK